MKVNFDAEAGVLTIEIKNSETPVGALTIKKAANGYLHHFSWATGSDLELLPKPIGEYSLKARAGGYAWLLNAYGRAVGVKPDSSEFREKVWKPFLKALQSSEEYEKFKKEGVTTEVSQLREYIKKAVIYRLEDREQESPVKLYVEYLDRQEVLHLTTNSVRKLDRVQEAFLKTYGVVPEELVKITADNWVIEVLNWMYSQGNVEFQDFEDTEVNYIAEAILNKVRSLEISTDKQDLSFENFAWYDGLAVVVPGKIVLDTIRDMGLKLSMRKIREILSPYLKKNSDVIRIDSQTRIRCWFFDPEKLEIDLKEVIGNEL